MPQVMDITFDVFEIAYLKSSALGLEDEHGDGQTIMMDLGAVISTQAVPSSCTHMAELAISVTCYGESPVIAKPLELRCRPVQSAMMHTMMPPSQTTDTCRC